MTAAAGEAAATGYRQFGGHGWDRVPSRVVKVKNGPLMSGP
jgi:hypothetical protein